MPLATTTRILAPFLDRLTGEELDAVPYGVIQLNAQGLVLSFNRAEILNSGWREGRPIGRDYFRDIAPSSPAPEIFERFADAFAHHHCDDVFRFTFTHSDLPRTVQIRMYYAARTDTIWIFTARPDGSPIGSGEGIDIDAPQEQARVA